MILSMSGLRGNPFLHMGSMEFHLRSRASRNFHWLRLKTGWRDQVSQENEPGSKEFRVAPTGSASRGLPDVWNHCFFLRNNNDSGHVWPGRESPASTRIFTRHHLEFQDFP